MIFDYNIQMKAYTLLFGIIIFILPKLCYDLADQIRNKKWE
ncbi:MAG TPA: hypothetical protein VMZ91_15510 [Candidatus Paceibacterota bacterium]|nr:hypothetical protein [Candidatus Paceibacterota bacterium]